MGGKPDFVGTPGVMLALPSSRLLWKATAGGLVAPFGHHWGIGRQI